jgi:hypothetical protein
VIIMPIPATTGVLRTKVQDMEIGDYIKFGTSQTNGNYILGEDVTETYVELPVSGRAWNDGNNGYFGYMVKVSKGMIIHDRVIRHSVSWDTLNTGKLIQGKPFDSGNIIPTMTSNTAPSGVASASSEDSSMQAWKAFDKSTGSTDCWYASTLPAWLEYDFIQPKVIRGYAVRSRNLSASNAKPTAWTFEGSNDSGITWEELDKQTGISFGNNELKTFYIRNSKEYKKYRINVTASGTTNLAIGELEMFDTVGTIRSLTGGVKRLDESNVLQTGNGIGVGFPENNEWARYVVNFPAELIAPGKVLDDVFHVSSGIATWTQDTPTVGNTTRAYTTYSSGKPYWSYTNSATSASYVGFRPVFAYKE